MVFALCATGYFMYLGHSWTSNAVVASVIVFNTDFVYGEISSRPIWYRYWQVLYFQLGTFPLVISVCSTVKLYPSACIRSCLSNPAQWASPCPVPLTGPSTELSAKQRLIFKKLSPGGCTSCTDFFALVVLFSVSHICLICSETKLIKTSIFPCTCLCPFINSNLTSGLNFSASWNQGRASGGHRHCLRRRYLTPINLLRFHRPNIVILRRATGLWINRVFPFNFSPKRNEELYSPLRDARYHEDNLKEAEEDTKCSSATRSLVLRALLDKN